MDVSPRRRDIPDAVALDRLLKAAGAKTDADAELKAAVRAAKAAGAPEHPHSSRLGEERELATTRGRNLKAPTCGDTFSLGPATLRGFDSGQNERPVLIL
jgi:hypothetical protein